MSRLFAALFVVVQGVSLPPSRAAMAVHVVDYAAVSNNDVARAERETTRIWNNIDVSLTWSIGDVKNRAAAAGPVRALDVSVLLLNQEMAQRMITQEHRGPGVLARAVPEAMRVYVFYDRVKMEGERYADPRGVILGRVVAHELAHLLLGHTHSDSGLFRAEPDLGSAREAFDREDGEKIRSDIFRRMSSGH
ncbi:MAG TPA: hypothetical protein VHZ73_02570 [Vicinamibacterales bacterium]|jgi:hypothetical protein|nr:hypothetical protein [Vicinamibacterales bacterium]